MYYYLSCYKSDREFYVSLCLKHNIYTRLINEAQREDVNTQKIFISLCICAKSSQGRITVWSWDVVYFTSVTLKPVLRDHVLLFYYFDLIWFDLLAISSTCVSGIRCCVVWFGGNHCFLSVSGVNIRPDSWT